MKVYIAGAHSRAQTLKEYITYLYPQTDIIAFLVDDMQDNKEYVENIPVKVNRYRLRYFMSGVYCDTWHKSC